MLQGMFSAGSITDVSISLPALNEVIDVLLFRAGYNSMLVMCGTTLLGVAAGIVGSFALLRKRALMGDALAHSALPGLCLAYIISVLLGFEGRNFLFLLLGAAFSGVVGVVTVQFLTRFTRLSEDSSIGAVLSVFFGVGVVLLSIIQSMGTGGAAGLNQFIYGQTAAMRSFDAVLISFTALFSIFSAFFLMKEFSLVSFDPDFALVQGWPVSKIDLLMMSLVTIVTVIGLQSVGIILIVSLLIIPAAAARFWTERLSLMIVLSAAIGGISGYAGAAASTLLPRFPAGAVIVLITGVIFFISFLFAPQRGVLVGLVRLALLRFRVVKDHLLRDIYEVHEKKQRDLSSTISYAEVPYLRVLTSIKRIIALQYLSLTKVVVLEGDQLSLTERGIEQTKKLIRNHRLWEQYIFEFAEVSQSHVDYSADFAEHVLSPEIVKQLEQRLIASGRNVSITGGSIHPINGN